jgi:AcrR family transcriptional regulator
MTTEAAQQGSDRLPPRQRLLEAAADLFYRRGIRAVGVEAVADAAGTNKMTLYRHFSSKDELVAEYLRQAAEAGDACWARFEELHPGDPRGQLHAWLEEMAGHILEGNSRGCALANAAVEIAEKDHPARRVIEDCKLARTKRLASLCASAGLLDPDGLADELELLIEGARMRAQSVRSEGLGERVLRMGQAIIAAHQTDRRDEERAATI